MKSLTGPGVLALAAQAEGPRPLLLDVREPWDSHSRKSGSTA